LQLILATPKSLLRHPRARSLVEDIQPGSRFQRLIPETDTKIFSGHGVPNPAVTRLVLCSGKVYYELLQAREALSELGIAIARIEQIAPFPYDLVAQHADVSVWVCSWA
jgi:2-oxoglutarate dehydrogenase E1 component